MRKALLFSSTICEEFVKIMGKKVLNAIVQKSKKQSTFLQSLILGPDISYRSTEVVIRNVRITDGENE